MKDGFIYCKDTSAPRMLGGQIKKAKKYTKAFKKATEGSSNGLTREKAQIKMCPTILKRGYAQLYLQSAL